MQSKIGVKVPSKFDLGKLVDELPICKDGKIKVKELIRAMGHEVSNQDCIKSGNVVRPKQKSANEEYRLVIKGDGRYKFVDIKDGDVMPTMGDDFYEYVADNLDHFYEKKQRGEL